MYTLSLYSYFIHSKEIHTLRKEFPIRISNWTSIDVVYDKKLLINVLSPDKILYKNYMNEDGKPPITLFMAYYQTLEKSDLSHSPIVCFTGQGWEIENTAEKEIPINLPNAVAIRVNQMVQKKYETTMITLFWYQSVNRAFANRGLQKLSLFSNKLLRKPDNNAFVRLTIIVPPGKSIEEMYPHLFGFVRDLYPELQRFFL